MQEDPLPSKSNFPKDNAGFLKYLLIDKSPFDRFFETADAALDIQRALSEWLQLRASPMFRGEDEGAPRGKGVVVIAGGFGTTKINYYDSAKVFERLGYSPAIYIPKPGVNISPVERNENDFMDFLNQFDEKVYLIGHSKGGLQTYAAYATRRDEFVAKVKHWVLVCSPRPEWVNVVVGAPYLGAQIAYGGDDFRFASEILNNVDVENIDGTVVTAIGNPNDPIIRGKMVGKPDEQFLTDSSHSGALLYPPNLRFISRRFAEYEAA